MIPGCAAGRCVARSQRDGHISALNALVCLSTLVLSDPGSGVPGFLCLL